MADNVWYIEAAHGPTTARSYVPEPGPALDEQGNRTALSRIRHLASTGQPIPAEMLPVRRRRVTGQTRDIECILHSGCARGHAPAVDPARTGRANRLARTRAKGRAGQPVTPREMVR